MTTPLPEQGGFNERLDGLEVEFLHGVPVRLPKEARAAIRTLILEELESKAERLFEWDGGQYEPVEAVPLSVIKKLGGTHGTK